MRRILFAVLLAFLTTSCVSPLKIGVRFDGETKMMPRSSIMCEDTMIGEISKVEYDGSKTTVTAVIKPEFRDRMTEKTMFFRVYENKEERVMVLFFEDENAEKLKEGEIVYGSGGTMYYALRAGKSAVGKVMDFFKSEEWKEFREDVSEKVKGALNTTKEELDRETFEIRKEASEFIDEMKRKYGDDFGKKVQEFTDSLIEELKLK